MQSIDGFLCLISNFARPTKFDHEGIQNCLHKIGKIQDFGKILDFGKIQNFGKIQDFSAQNSNTNTSGHVWPSGLYIVNLYCLHESHLK